MGQDLPSTKWDPSFDDHECMLQAIMQAQATADNYNLQFNAAASNISLTSSSTGCNKKFGKYCLDGTSLSKGDVAGIIVGGSIFVIIVIAAIAFLAIRILRRRSATT